MRIGTIGLVILLLCGCGQTQQAPQAPTIPLACADLLARSDAREKIMAAHDRIAAAKLRLLSLDSDRHAAEQRADFARGVAQSADDDVTAAQAVGDSAMEQAASKTEDLESAKSGVIEKGVTAIQKQEAPYKWAQWASFAEMSSGPLMPAAPGLGASDKTRWNEHNLFCEYALGKIPNPQQEAVWKAARDADAVNIAAGLQ